MNVFLWILQGLFGLLFVVHGFALVVPPTAMRGTFEALPYGKGFLQFIGVCEVLGGLGLVLPRWLGVWPALTPLAAAGLAIIMVGAAVTHLRARETQPGVGAFVITLLLAVVAALRWA
ncbi:DoxX family protein [Deinococcus sp.]|uniref:DoxX family protein n=1 Tax=Deinococcus sp. TaxID=47478 RepID=UPI003C7CCEDD